MSPGSMRAAKLPHMEPTPEERVLPAPSEASYFLKKIFLVNYLFVAPRSLWDLNSLARDRTYAPCGGRVQY